MNLRALGLSEYEEKTYKAMIKLGKATASEISREGEVSYGKIYEVLSSLERKSLVKVVPEKTKKFVADTPDKLSSLVENKEKELASLKDELKSLKKVYEVHEEEIVHIVKGKRNFYTLLRDIKEPKKFKYMIKHTSEFHPEWVRQDKKLVKNGVDIRSLVRHNEETEKSVRKWLKINKNIRKIENKGVAIDIREEQVVIGLLNNNTIMSIKDKAFIDVMKTLFLNTYQNAEKLSTDKKA